MVDSCLGERLSGELDYPDVLGFPLSASVHQAEAGAAREINCGN
jgi:hypothetical protein